MFAGNFAAPGALCRGISPPAGGELLCPWRLVVAKSACLRFRLTAKTAPAPLLLLFPANPLRWASPGVRERLTKTPPGTAQDERSALIFAFPRTPFTGLPLEPGKKFPARGNLSECLNSRRATGPWGCKNCRWCGSASAPGSPEPARPVRMLSGRSGTGPYVKRERLLYPL